MDINRDEIASVVREVIARLEKEKISSSGPEEVSSGGGVLYDSMEDAVSAAKRAQKKFLSISLASRQNIIESIRKAARSEAGNLARNAEKETGMGRWEDKVKKNLLAADKTPGIEDLQPVAYTGDRGLTLIENAPFGVIGSVTPSTNPTSTIINNAISIIAAGNAAVFAPHPAAMKCSQQCMQILSDAAVAAGAPEGLITAMRKPSLEGAEVLFTHPDIRLLIVTGGPAVVEKAMKTDKKVIAAGPGNPPVVVDETADPVKTVDSIINGAGFDNGILCTAEKEVLLAGGCHDSILKQMRSDVRAFELTESQMEKLASIAIEKSGRGGGHPIVNRDFIGKDASVIGKALGLDVGSQVRLLWALVDENNDFMWTEQLMPVLPFAISGDIKRTIDLAVEMEGGNGHTAIMHSLNVESLTEMARKSACSIFVKNGPSYMGLGMGEGYATLSIATPTGDGLVKARNFTRPLRCSLVDYFRIT